MSKLKSCPFCGGEATSTYGGASPDDWPERHGCEACWVFTEKPEAWNRRAQPQQPAQRPDAGYEEPQHEGRSASQERGAAFVLPFGKYKNQSLGEIGATPKGRDYLEWLRNWEGVRPETREAVEAFLGVEPEAEHEGRADEAAY